MIPTTNIVQHIITNYDQISLFAKYMGLTVEDIEYCLENKANKINNPLRNDYKPSLGFMYKNIDGKLQSKDWGDDSYSGDIFDIIGLLSELNSNDSIEFMKIVNIIISGNSINTNIKDKVIHNLNNKAFKVTKFMAIPYTKAAIKYWSDAGVKLSHLKFRNVYYLKYVWIDNMESPWYSNYNNNLVFGYHLDKNANGTDNVKIYMPNEVELKFRSNSNCIFEALHELYPAKVLIITKSRKDKLVIESLLEKGCIPFFLLAITKQDTIPTYCVTSFNSESYRIKPELANYLNRTYEHIIINTDFDKQGILNSFYHNILYNYTSVFLGNNTMSINDFSDKELSRYFSRINLINPELTLFSGLLSYFIESHSDDFKDKDLFEYSTNNGVEAAQELINELFNYKQFKNNDKH